MGLTSGLFFVVMIVAAVVAVGVTMAGWARLRGPLVARWLVRLTMIGCCQATAVAVVAVWLNDSNSFYTSWADLFGRENPPSVAADPTAPAADFRPAGDGMLTAMYHGPESGLTGQVMVWIPPQYREPAYRGYRFPVIMLLHGIPGSPQGWVTRGDAPARIGALMSDGRLTPAVLVIPRIDPGHINTDCTDVPGGARDATWLADDVPNLIKSTFRVADSGSGWGMVGISTGGYCAAKLTLQYPKTFTAAVALSPDNFDGDPDVLPSAALRRANDPVELADDGASVSILVATTTDDQFSATGDAEALYRAAKWPTTVAEPLILSGGHNWGTWHATYPVIFGWLSEHLNSREMASSAADRLRRLAPPADTDPNRILLPPVG
jgi:enterochelin esterase-like enzyme